MGFSQVVEKIRFSIVLLHTILMERFLLCLFRFLPFIGDADSGIDGAGEGDVVEGEKELGEDVRVEGRLVPEWPLPNWKYQ